MKKFIFGFLALILIGIVVMSLPKQGNKDGKQKTVTVEDSVDDDNWFYITRYSEYMFGNSAPLEHMKLFPEILEDADEENEDDGETDG